QGGLPPTTVEEFPWRLDVFAFAGYSQRILWNFIEADSLSLDGSEQWSGTVLAPSADLYAHTSINGQVLVGGNFEFDGNGTEIHSFPWTGCVTPLDEPDPETG